MKRGFQATGPHKQRKYLDPGEFIVCASCTSQIWNESNLPHGQLLGEAASDTGCDDVFELLFPDRHEELLIGSLQGRNIYIYIYIYILKDESC